MHADYYQNISYPLQNRVLKIIGNLDVEFYLTGGTALSRIYLNHRFSDDLDFFVNGASDFKHQVSTVLKGLSSCISRIITDILEGAWNSLYTKG